MNTAHLAGKYFGEGKANFIISIIVSSVSIY